MSEDRLPRWEIGPIVLSSLLTGAMAAFAYCALLIFDNPLFFPRTVGFELVLAVASITLVGLTVGLIVVLPIAMIFSAIGIRMALRKLWIAHGWAWAATGAVVGAVILLVPFVLPSNDDPQYLVIALFGAVCGMIAALLCHRFLNVGRAD